MSLHVAAPVNPMPIVLPSYIKDVNAVTEFNRIVKLLGKNITELDQSLVVDYAVTHAEIIKLRSVVANEGEVLVGRNGGAYMNPKTNLLLNKIGHLSKLRDDLQFTPKSRKAKIAPPRKKSLAESLEP